MSKDITKQNITNFLQGYGRQLLSGSGLLDDTTEEQIAYRLLKCKDDCLVAGACKRCGCAMPARAFSTQSCNNGELFPDLMSKDEWEKYKQEHGI